MEIVRLPIDLVEENKGQVPELPENPREWNDDDVQRIARSLRETPELFEMRPCIVYPHAGKYVLLAGNLRYCGARANGDQEVPCFIVPEGTPVEKLCEIVIKDNGSFGSWDTNLLLKDWGFMPLTDWGVPAYLLDSEAMENSMPDPEAQEDNFDENQDQVKKRCEPGDVWQLGHHRLKCGDSTSAADIQDLMRGERADLWLTDPPYNVAIENSKGMTIKNDSMESGEFGEFLTSAFQAAVGVLAPGCPFYIWFASREHINFEQSLKRAGLKVRQELIWNKNHAMLGWSHYQWKHEPCLYGWKGDNCRYFVDSRSHTTVISDSEEYNLGSMKKSEMRDLLEKLLADRVATTVINENAPMKDDEHPTMKPVRLFGYQVSNSSKRGDIVLDSFGGSGTTIVACEQLGRKARLMELDPHYCDVILARWEKLTGMTAERLTTNENK